MRFGHLPAEAVDAIARSAERAGFFDRPDLDPAVKPDARSCVLTLRIGARSRTIRIAEPVADATLAELVSIVRTILGQDTGWSKPLGR